jgi:predicted nucleotidyltransferase
VRTQDIRECIGRIAGDLGVQRAILFGSHGRGTQTRKSDVDLILVRDTDEGFLDRIGSALPVVCQALGFYAVDLLVYTPQEYDRMLAEHNRFLERALREGLVVYERGREPARS